MGKKKTTARAARPVKDREARAAEAEMIRGQLDDLGFPAYDADPLHKALRDFADLGYGTTEKHSFPHLGVSVTLQLSTQPHIVSYARVSRLAGAGTGRVTTAPGTTTSRG